MNYIYIGEIVNTHGLKGEVRIISDFKYKSKVFIKGMAVYVGKNKESLIINSYRIHKTFDMVTFVDFLNINDVLIFKGEKVYINKEDINIDGYFDEDLINLDVYGNNLYIGKVITILKGVKNDNLVIKNNNIQNIIPNIKEFVKNVDLENKRIDINLIEGLINEN
ncbi:MAG: ribosome maturation factor RimM [Bacilli bacterium]